MTPVLSSVGVCLASYLLGSVPFGLVLGRLHGIDIRHTGSGNIGATNLARSLGRGWGILAFLLDFMKGFLPVLCVSKLVAYAPDAYVGGSQGWLALAAGFAAFLGHIYPVFLGFRGGKGVATAFGVVTACAWLAALLAGAVWLVLFAFTRVVSLASLAAALTLPAAAALQERVSPGDNYVAVQTLTAIAAAFIVIRHRSNISRLIRGEEFHFGGRSGGRGREASDSGGANDSKADRGADDGAAPESLGSSSRSEA